MSFAIGIDFLSHKNGYTGFQERKEEEEMNFNL